MAWLVSVLGVVVSAGFIIAAGIMNWRYGLGLGRSPEDQILFAAIAAGVDAMKVLLPFFMWWSLKNKRWIACALSCASIAGLVLCSVAGVAGFVDLNRATTTGNVLAKKDTLADLRSELSRKQAQRDALGEKWSRNFGR